MVALGIAIAAIILFVGTGGSMMPQLWRAWFHGEAPPDLLLTNAMLLNIALLLFGWRRYNDLQREVRDRRGAEERARELAETDPLTSCLNRRSGQSAIDAMLATVGSCDEALAVFMVDLDKFKQINDFRGHQAGDLVLVEIARRMRALLPPEAVLARIGGDEFICALPFSARSPELAEDLASALIMTIGEPVKDDCLWLEITASIGIATTGDLADDTPLDADTLVHRADLAMYDAKKSGRNRHCRFELRMETEMRLRSELEAGIRSGISAGEFQPYYEQQIELETGELAGFEMLARWHSPKHGLVSPDVFIPIAEEMDLIAPLSERLIRLALIDAKSWAPHLTLSVNISPVQLRDPWFAQKILQMLVETGFPPQRLELEITESCLHENIGAVRAIVTSLRNQGIRISLDDFGTGYSSISQLRMLTFDRLKIDRSFVAELAANANGAEMIEAIISLGRSLQLPITAEGVESEEVLGLLRTMGELKGQGYLYGRPEDAATTRQRLAAQGLLIDAAAPPQPTAQPAEPPARRKAG